MVIVPTSNIILLKTPIEIGDDNQLTWSTKQEQYTYFNSLPKLSLDDATYQRKDNEIRFPTSLETTYEDLIQYNYCMYQNEAYNDKWFYAYITEINYINDGMSTIKIETDVWNTWCFDLTLKQSFVEREHVNDDTIGLHTLPENVETGEYLPMDSFEISYGTQGDKFYCCFGVTYDILQNSSGVTFYGGVPNGFTYIVIKDSDVISFISKYNGRLDDIQQLFLIPKKLVASSSFTWQVIDGIHYYYPTGAGSIGSINIPRPSQLGVTTSKYTPKNKKLLTKQFNFIMGDNLVGGTAPYYYEYFYDPTSCNFSSYGVLTAGCSIKAYPTAYKYTDNGSGVIIDNSGFSEGLMCAKLPVGSWNKDTYINWLTQNGVNIGLSLAKSGVNMLTGGISSMINTHKTEAVSSSVNSAFGIADTLAQVYEHTFLPNQVEGNVNAGDITFTRKDSEIKYYRMTIKEEYAKIIDDYFSMYGYKVNSLKIPNIRGRRNWNYVKTIGCNITGDIPQIDLEKIRNQFDRGVTFWHHTNTFLDYSQNNDII